MWSMRAKNAMIVDACHTAGSVEQQKGLQPGPMGGRGLGRLSTPVLDNGHRCLRVCHDGFKDKGADSAMPQDKKRYGRRMTGVWCSPRVPQLAEDAEKSQRWSACRTGPSPCLWPNEE